MTSTLVGRLVEASQLRWNMTVSELLSPKLPDIRSKYRHRTLIGLFDRHAGLPRD
jgi:CubicO group peptidase (beta-lactamase class C family)